MEARWAATCVRIMKVTLNSPVNIAFMARTIITPILQTPSDFSPFQFHFHSLKDLQLFANNHKCLDSIANPVCWQIKFVSAIEKLKNGNDRRCATVFFNVTFIILLSCSPLILSSYLILN